MKCRHAPRRGCDISSLSFSPSFCLTTHAPTQQQNREGEKKRKQKKGGKLAAQVTRNLFHPPGIAGGRGGSRGHG